jgi:arylsulfatase A-like enzyme
MFVLNSPFMRQQADALAERIRHEGGKSFDSRVRYAHQVLFGRDPSETGGRRTWDTHSKHNAGNERLCKDIDRPIAQLLTDLKQRGLLEETLVIWGGEFGRTPTSQNGDGRDHNPYGFTMWLAGGGIKGGTVHGASDDFGFTAVENKVHVHDLHATILHLLGLDHKRLTYHYSGRDFRLTDVHGHVVKNVIA